MDMALIKNIAPTQPVSKNLQKSIPKKTQQTRAHRHKHTILHHLSMGGCKKKILPSGPAFSWKVFFFIFLLSSWATRADIPSMNFLPFCRVTFPSKLFQRCYTHNRYLDRGRIELVMGPMFSGWAFFLLPFFLFLLSHSLA